MSTSGDMAKVACHLKSGILSLTPTRFLRGAVEDGEKAGSCVSFRCRAPLSGREGYPIASIRPRSGRRSAACPAVVTADEPSVPRG